MKMIGAHVMIQLSIWCQGGSGPPGEQAAAEERALQRPVSVHAAAAEAGDLARGIEAGKGLARCLEHARGQVRLQTAERLAGEDVQADGDQRAGVGVEDPVRRRDAGDLVGEVGAGAVDRGDLAVLGEGVGDLAVARDDLGLERRGVDQVLAGERVHPPHQLRQRALDDEVLALVQERLHG
jgi:hypothetical protein